MTNKRKWGYIPRFWLLHSGMLFVGLIVFFANGGKVLPAVGSAVLIYLLPAFAHYIRGFGTKKEMEEYYLWSKRKL